MARKPRVELPGALYHVTARGNNRGAIFIEKEEYLYYIKRLRIVKKRYDFHLYSFCLMPNHLHLLIQTSEVPLSRVMSALQTSYARYFNRKNKRTGHVFQGRYKAVLCDSDAYLLELVRYIHLNPVRAGMVQYPQNHPWNSHMYYLSSLSDDIVDKDFVLAMFARTMKQAPIRFHEFVLERLGDKSRQECLHKATDQRFLGDDDFIETVKQVLGNHNEERLEFRKVIEVKLKDILTSVAGYFCIDELDIVGTTRSRNIAFTRHIFIYTACEKFGFRGKEIARFLKRDDSSVSLATRRIRELILVDQELKATIDTVSNLITK